MTIKQNYIILWETPEGELAAEKAPNASASDLEFIVENPPLERDGLPVAVFALGERVI